MATNFPGSLDSFSNPSSSSTLDSPSHAAQHSNVNDAVEALQAKVGVDGSAVTGSLDYKVAQQGLTLVKSQTIGSAVSSVTVTGAFSSTFDNYKIVVSGGVASGNDLIYMRLGSTTTGYDTARIVTSSGTTSSVNVDNTTQFLYFGQVSANFMYANIDLVSPFLATWTFLNGSYSFPSEYGLVSGALKNTTSYTSFIIYPNANTLTGGTIRVYGYNNG